MGYVKKKNHHSWSARCYEFWCSRNNISEPHLFTCIIYNVLLQTRQELKGLVTHCSGLLSQKIASAVQDSTPGCSLWTPRSVASLKVSKMFIQHMTDYRDLDTGCWVLEFEIKICERWYNSIAAKPKMLDARWIECIHAGEEGWNSLRSDYRVLGLKKWAFFIYNGIKLFTIMIM